MPARTQQMRSAMKTLHDATCFQGQRSSSIAVGLNDQARPCTADAKQALRRSMQTGSKHAWMHALSCRAHLRSLTTSGLLVATAVQLSCLLMSSSVRATAAQAAPSACCGTGSRGIAMSQPHTEAQRVTASGDCKFRGWSMLGAASLQAMLL